METQQFDLNDIVQHTSNYDKILLFNFLVEYNYDIERSLEEFFAHTTGLFDCDSLVQFVGETGELVLSAEYFDRGLVIIVSNSENEIFHHIDKMILQGFILQKVGYAEYKIRKDLKHHYYYQNLTLIDLPICMN